MSQTNRSIPKKELIFISVILVILFAMILTDTDVKILVNYDEQMLQITSPRLNLDIEHAHVLSVELLEMPDSFGTKVGDSYEHEVYCAGTWENSDWGTYSLCVLPGNEKCILVKMDFTTVLFCCTTDAQTEKLFESYHSYLKQ